MIGRHDAHVRLGHRDRVRGLAHIEKLRDTEVEQLRCAVSGYQDVARLEVAMNDQIAVGSLHRRAHHAKQLQACTDTQPVPVAIHIDGLALDVFEHQVRNAFRSVSPVKEPGNIGMIERREDLSFRAQPGLYLPRQHAAADELDGDLLLILLVRPLAQVHLAHPAVTQHAQDLVRADAVAGTIRARSRSDLVAVGR